VREEEREAVQGRGEWRKYTRRRGWVWRSWGMLQRWRDLWRKLTMMIARTQQHKVTKGLTITLAWCWIITVGMYVCVKTLKTSFVQVFLEVLHDMIMFFASWNHAKSLVCISQFVKLTW